MVEMPSKSSAPQDGGDKKKAAGRASIAYPYFDLNLSLEVPKVIHEKGGGTCTADQLAAFLNYKSVNSGTYQTRVSAARQFGLIRSENGVIVVTERAQQIFSPVMPEDAINARAEAFLSVELFSEIFEKYKGGTIPPEAGLRNLLLQSYGFSQDRAGPAVRVLIDSAEQAGFFVASGDKSRLIRPSVRASNGSPAAPANPSAPAADQHAEKPKVSGGGGDGPAGVHSAIIGLLRDLPAPGSHWPPKQKARFVKAFQATLDFVYPSDDEEEL
jgi:hypothetical protein